jgi:tRNA nucleotidyltransferase (CCA-adding enzyme)
MNADEMSSQVWQARLDQHLPEGQRRRLANVCQTAQRMGLAVYVVGGFVRDLCLGLAPGDLDLVVEGDAPRLARAVAREFGGAVTTHAPFGTATWQCPDGSSLDFATARTETYRKPAALPDVTPADIAADLRRRDFTINAMALRLAGEVELLDPFNGQSDLDGRWVRVLYALSFQDDPTRLFRAVRYEQRLDLALAPETLALVGGAWEALAALTGDRVRHELELIFRERRAPAMIARLAALGILWHVHPALDWGPAQARLAALISDLPASAWRLASAPEPDAFYLALLLSEAPSADVEAALARLNINRRVTEAVRAAVSLKLAGTRPRDLVVQLDTLDELAVMAAYVVHAGLRSRLHDYLASWRFVRAETTGDDLVAQGLTPGPRFKEILWEVRAARLEGQVTDAQGEQAIVRRMLDGH